MTASHGAVCRFGPTGEAANELVSVITGIVASADVLADGGFGDAWSMQLELGALDDALTRALELVRQISALAPAPSQAATAARTADPETLQLAAPAAVGGFEPDARWDT